jgi:hypothetical protein
MTGSHFSEESKQRDDAKKAAEKQEHTEEAFEQAEKDISKDSDFKPDDTEDLDEGELARKEGHP